MPFLDLRRQANADEILLAESFSKVVERGRFIGGRSLEAFEERFSDYCRAPHAVGVNSGTDAIALALRALGVGPGDEVITAANTCVATVTGIAASGATTVLADVDEVTWTLDPASARSAVTERTRAIVPVHLYGHCADLAPLRELGLPIVEDAAQAHGAEYEGKRRGELAAYSFYPTKNLGALGDAGAIVTFDEELAERLRMLRSHGERAEARGIAVLPGVNSRLDELQAEVLLRRIERLDERNARRQRAGGVLPGAARRRGRLAAGGSRGNEALLAPLRRAGARPRGVPRAAARARRRDARALPGADPRAGGLRAPAARRRAGVGTPLRAGREPAALPGADRPRGGAGGRGGARGVRFRRNEPVGQASGLSRPEWEHIPEGWSYPTRGWDAEAVADAYARKWRDYVEAVQPPKPLGVHHETAEVLTGDAGAHNMLVTFAYVLALAADARDRLSVLDWGGGFGHYQVLARSVLSRLTLDWHVQETPAVAARGRELNPEVTFHDDDAALDGRYDLVVASSSIQYAEDWRALLERLARSAERYLYLARVPIALEAPSFVVIQRPYVHGYDTEYLGWVLNRGELLAAAPPLAREFLLDARFSAAGAPEEPVDHRSFLFTG